MSHFSHVQAQYFPSIGDRVYGLVVDQDGKPVASSLPCQSEPEAQRAGEALADIINQQGA